MDNQTNETTQANDTTQSNKNNFINFFTDKLYLLFYLVIVVSLVLIFNRFNFRLDLTKDNIFTLSKISTSIVSDLKEPLRIKVFISKNLPPPLNDLETSLRDLLEEYAEVANDNFNFVFYDVTEKDGEVSEEIKNNIAIAQDYGIYPQQVQTIEKDEVKLVKVYSGVVVEYGDLIERIPFVQSTENLEFQFTTIFEKMNNKINSLLSLDNNVKVTLYLEDQFVTLAPFFNISGLDQVSEQFQTTMETVKQLNYGRVDFEVKSLLSSDEIQKLQNQGVRVYPWNSFSVPQKGKFPAGNGVAAITVEIVNDGVAKSEFIELLRPESSLKLGQNGLQQVTHFVLLELGQLVDVVDAVIDGLLQVNDNIAYLNSKQALSVTPQQPSPFNPQGGQGDAENFFKLINRTYTVDPIDFDQINEKYKSLIIAGTKESFSDYELYLIDQFLMRGKSLIVFYDTYYNSQQNNPMAQFQQTPPQWIANDNRLADMLKHYGVEVEKAYVLDKKSYVARQQTANGGVSEQNIFFAPIIGADSINKDFDVIKQINEFIILEASPVKLITDRIAAQDITTTRLFSSSEESWLMKDNIMLIPGVNAPPVDPVQFSQYDLGYMLEGEFDSYFAGKSIPLKEESKKTEVGVEEGKDKKLDQTKQSIATFSSETKATITKGKPGKIMVVGTSSLLRNDLFDQNGISANTVFILNLIDYANDRGDWAIMRGKGQRSKPLIPYKAGDSFFTNRDFLKSFNIVGLPILVCFGGLISFYLRGRKRKKISVLFK